MIKSLEKISRKHYMQCGLVVVLTGIFLYLTSFLWMSKGIVVSFDVESAKDVEYRIYYTEKLGQKFNYEQSIKKNTRKGKQHVEIILPINKLVKFRLDLDSRPVSVILKNLRLIGLKKVILNYNKFSKHQIDGYAINDEELLLSSNKKDPHITYKPKLDLSAGISIDWYMLIILATLSFLGFNKLVHYLAKFKLQERYSRIDIVMLAVFFGLLWVPMSHISDADKSEQENRMLAKYQPLWQRGHLNYQFGTDFEKWYNDRFSGRNLLISLYNDIKFNVSVFIRNERAIKASDDMIFNMEIFDTLSHPIPDKVKKEISDNIAELQKFAQKNNIDLYIMVPPSKEDIYMYKLSKIFSNIDREKSIIYDLQKYISEKNKLDIIYPRDIYLQDYKDLTHSKTDHHWTEFGAFLGYKSLIDEIRKKYPQIKELKESDFNTFYKDKPRSGGFKGVFDRPYYRGSNCNALGLKSNCPSYPHKYYDHKDLKQLKVKYGPINMSRITHYGKGIKANVTLLGNSYGGYLMEFLPYNFESVQMLRVNNRRKGVINFYNMKRFEKYILDFHTDILIFHLASSYFLEFTNLYKD